MTRHTALWWIERGLLAVGVVLAIYCAAILVEARFHQTAPLTQPPLTVTQTVLPGDSGDPKARLNAIATLARRLRPEVRNRIAGMLEQSADGTFVESDPDVRRAAAAAVRSIDRARTFYSGIETLFFGLSLG